MSQVGACSVPAGRDRADPIVSRPAPSLPYDPAAVTATADLAAALEPWRDLAAVAAATPYQMPGWVVPWSDTVGASLGITPSIVVARDHQGCPVAVLPLGLSRQGGVRVAGFLGGKDSNFNMGLFRPGSNWTRPAVDLLLRRASAAIPGGVDLFAFRNQPHGWGGTGNPFLALPHQPSPSFAYKAALDPDPDLFLKRHLSRDSRKKLRQKMNRLRAIGPVVVSETRDRSDVVEMLDAFVAQRGARNAAAGLPSDDLPALRSFLDRVVGREGSILFYALRCGGRIVATLGGVVQGDRFSGMLTSFAPEEDLARASPGELLLAEVMQRCCSAGLATFDLGVGEARYKETYCPEVEPLFDSLVPMTPRGHVLAVTESVRLRLKRRVKQSRWGWPIAQRLRRLIAVGDQ